MGTILVDGIEVPWVTTDMTDPDGHGTRMAAMAAGNELGIAPYAQLVIVKWLSQPKEVQGSKFFDWMMAALRDILLDIQARGSGTSSVIEQALILRSKSGQPFFSPGSPYHLLYENLFATGVTVVTGAGNSALDGSPEIDAYPAFLGTTTDYPIIIVGGVNSDGSIWPKTQGLQSGRIDVFALGSNIVSAEANTDPDGEVITSGTSGASAAVSGLVAYFLGLQTAMAQKVGDPILFSAWMREHVQSFAYPRIAGGPKVIYNGAPANALDSICASNMDNDSGSVERPVLTCSACACTASNSPTVSPTGDIIIPVTPTGDVTIPVTPTGDVIIPVTPTGDVIIPVTPTGDVIIPVTPTTTQHSSTPPPVKPSPKTTSATPTPTPHADCPFWDELLAYEFEIYNIENWVTDGGKALKKQEDGCGTITGWSWKDATDTSDASVHFHIDFFIKSGCIERAIVSAGVPKISCAGGGVVVKPRKAEIEGPTYLPMSAEEEKTAISVYGNATAHSEYIPMDWSVGNSSVVSV